MRRQDRQQRSSRLVQIHGVSSACVLVIGACTVETSISGACLACLTVLVFPLRVTSRALRRTVPWGTADPALDPSIRPTAVAVCAET